MPGVDNTRHPLRPGSPETPPYPRPLREVRVERLLSMSDVAELAGVAHSTVYCTETGRTTPSLAVMRRIASALGVDPLEVSEFRHAIDSHSGRGGRPPAAEAPQTERGPRVAAEPRVARQARADAGAERDRRRAPPTRQSRRRTKDGTSDTR